MAVNLSPLGHGPFVDSSGDPLSGGLLYTYTAGSSTPENTYTTSAGSVAHANPIVLNSNGYPASGGNVASIWLTAGVSYKFTLKTSAGVTVWERDNIDGINDTAVTLDEWVAGPAPTYISSSSFSLVGDQTATFTVGRRVKVTDAGGTKYGTIKTSAFTTLTTITLDQDSDSLASPTSAVSYGLINPTNSSHPLFSDALALVGGSSDRSKKVRLEVDGLTTATTRALTVPDYDGTIATLAGTESLTNKTITGTTNTVGSGVLGTEQATTSGVAIDFTSIPSWVKKIYISLIGVSTNGTSVLILQIGDSGGVETSSYLGAAATVAAAGTTVSSNGAGFILEQVTAAANALHGVAILTLEDSSDNTWGFQFVGGVPAVANFICGGSKALSGTLDRIRLTATNGTDAFDAGAMNIIWE